MLGVDDPTDDRTADCRLRAAPTTQPRAARYGRGERSSVNCACSELRQLVDRDLLAGGPWKAQRELFEQQFAETLKKYQQSQDLNQENG